MSHHVAAKITGVDTHAHVFTHDLPMVPGRRYSPDYDALTEDYLAHLDEAGLSHGILVQPSFLGTDNSFLLEAIKKYPGRLKGTAVIEPMIDQKALDELAHAGITGIRLNLVGKRLEDVQSPEFDRLFTHIRAFGWFVEIQRSIDDVHKIIPHILECGVPVIIDHYALAQGGLNPQIASHARFLELLSEHDNLWVKISAPYRCHMSLDQAKKSFQLLRQACNGVGQLVWGSDWPHTQFEKITDYRQMYQFFGQLVVDEHERSTILVNNPARLFGIASN